MSDPHAVALRGADPRLPVSKLPLREAQESSAGLFASETRNVLF